VTRAERLAEEVLAKGLLVGGDEVQATRLALLVPARDLRVPWDRVTTATWDDPRLRVAAAGTTYDLELADEGLLPEVIRERVQASILVTEHVDLRGDSGARFSARRPPFGDSEIRWTVTFDPGLDPQDPQLRALAEQELDRLRQTYGV
jgi:hypothetical protein